MTAVNTQHQTVMQLKRENSSLKPYHFFATPCIRLKDINPCDSSSYKYIAWL